MATVHVFTTVIQNVSYPICIGTNKIGFCNSDCPNFELCKKESQKTITENEFKNLLKNR